MLLRPLQRETLLQRGSWCVSAHTHQATCGKEVTEGVFVAGEND